MGTTSGHAGSRAALVGDSRRRRSARLRDAAYRPRRQLEPHSGPHVAARAPAVGNRLEYHEAAPALAVTGIGRRARAEAEAAVRDLDFEPAAARPDPQPDRVVRARVLDAVGDDLGDQQLGVADQARVDVTTQLLDRAAR